jgi:hypothetical protein
MLVTAVVLSSVTRFETTTKAASCACRMPAVMQHLGITATRRQLEWLLSAQTVSRQAHPQVPYSSCSSPFTATGRCKLRLHPHACTAAAQWGERMRQCWAAFAAAPCCWPCRFL